MVLINYVHGKVKKFIVRRLFSSHDDDDQTATVVWLMKFHV